jgi:hypothetical protein
MGIDYASFKGFRICHDGTLLEGGPLTANALSEISNLETFKKRYDAQPRCAIIVGAGRGHGNRLKGEHALALQAHGARAAPPRAGISGPLEPKPPLDLLPLQNGDSLFELHYSNSPHMG